MSKKKVIGITGSMGSGKSKVASFLAKHYPVLDCDQVNAQLLEKGEKGYSYLTQLPWIVLDEKEQIDKKKMAQEIFNNEKKKKIVENILHPLILDEMKIWISKQASGFVFIEVPLLFESQMEAYFDSIWCVVVSKEIAFERLFKYRNFTLEQAKERIDQQMSVEEKKKRSSFVIENNGSLKDLEEEIHKTLRKEEVLFVRNE